MRSFLRVDCGAAALAVVCLGCTSPSKSSSDSGPGAPDDTGTPPDTGDGSEVWSEACPVDRIETRMIDVGEVSLNVGCMGDGPVVVLLHGFPEFHYAWRQVMEELAGEYRLIVPDQRGYNLSDKPEAVDAYTLDLLTADIVS